ncbi:replication initiation protein [Clostridium beijerinckii]|uniref:RepB family plasmid replication initiator protein n=1 Tax=Clostridium beijerinckii TaxID=1520 RepID=A0AAW3W7T9_CLOBE|nr:RepB family plasmid replication initiator protein [Clostridium beijerinckii]MBC2457780.1 RepB family plasmid replication initiator protein [Clostridium beijerinckii]MBC2475029.1 RepB family plasmid replication initiator protein [Clostridium beijerinckii]MDG5854922.1 RepB family plasmid replication initiator protein [Clostridium beijerinckii]NOV63495.1 plasmid replication initiation protein [Clostridium beijerinckii]NOV73292.1 plasmid replication initiation protein [Clostridium beijerinckii]
MNSDISIVDEEKAEDISEVLFKSNTLIKSNINITSVEYKIFNKILYKCQIEKENDSQLRAVLTIDELSSIVKNKKENTVKALTESLEKFIKIPIRFEKQKSYVITTLINKVVVDKDTLKFNCYLDKDLYEVLMGYKELGYSPINLKMIRQANGYYTQRFYELFRVWSGHNKEVTHTIDQLKEWLMIEEGTSYDRYFNFKTKVVEPALKEINQKLNMKVSYKENKAGRSVKSLTFIVEDLEPRIYDFSKDKAINKQISIDELALELDDSSYEESSLKDKKETLDATEYLKKSGFTIADSTIHRLKLKYGEVLVYDGVSIMCNKSKQGKITAPVKYLTGILENLNNKSLNEEADDSKKLRFNNFEPRQYDYDDLERKLLGWDK